VAEYVQLMKFKNAQQAAASSNAEMEEEEDSKSVAQDGAAARGATKGSAAAIKDVVKKQKQDEEEEEDDSDDDDDEDFDAGADSDEESEGYDAIEAMDADAMEDDGYMLSICVVYTRTVWMSLCLSVSLDLCVSMPIYGHHLPPSPPPWLQSCRPCGSRLHSSRRKWLS
jgi:hypothetical protein